MKRSVLLIYTGGTIGMVEDPRTGALRPFNFEELTRQVPELDRFDTELNSVSFEPPVDSSELSLSHWQDLAELIRQHYDDYDGFVVLHGTDTMCHSASALSFMLRGLRKPVIFTGSQLPIGVLRTDGKENLITAIQLAGLERSGESYVQEVAIYFGSSLYRGNRTSKYSTQHFNAIHSPNLAPLAEAGIHLNFRHDLLIRPEANVPFEVMPKMDGRLAILKLFPGINEETVVSLCSIPGLRGLIIETYGSGNAPTADWFLEALEAARMRGVTLVNVTQCSQGFVEQGRYAVSEHFAELGVIPAADMTTEAALTKLMHLLANFDAAEGYAELMMTPLAGELTNYSTLV